MQAKAILATIRAALEAVPIIANELRNLRETIVNVKNDQVERERQQILERLNTLSNNLRTTEDQNEMASIIRDLNRF